MTDSKNEIQLRLEPVDGPRDVKAKTLVDRGVIVVGRSSSTHLRLPKMETSHSRLHFVVEFNPPKCRLLDLGSRTGTFVNGKKIFSAYLQDGDVIKAGRSSFRVRIGANLPPLEKSAKSDDGEEAFYALEKDREKKRAARKSKDKSISRKARAKTTNRVKVETAVENRKVETAPPDHSSSIDVGGDSNLNFPPLPTNIPSKDTSDVSEVIDTPAAKPPAKRTPAGSGINNLDFDLDKFLEGSVSEVDMAASESRKGTMGTPSVPGAIPEIQGYELVKSLGKGLFGEVFLAKDRLEEKPFAIKLLHTERANESAAVTAFLNEMRPLLDLEHNHLVRYRDFGVVGDYIYVISDYFEGINAAQSVKSEGVMGPVRVAKLGCQLLHALDYAHGLGHVHRDIKPSNIIITSDKNREIAMLSDFGLARTFQNSPLYGIKRKSDLENSVRFMAPEQFQNFREMPISVDIYSTAATFYYLLTGKYVHDFESLSFDQAVTKIKRDDAININRFRMDLSGELANLIHQGLQRFPQKRIASAAAFRRDLYKFIK